VCVQFALFDGCKYLQLFDRLAIDVRQLLILHHLPDAGRFYHPIDRRGLLIRRYLPEPSSGKSS
jgi:hypothetical protein